jgi:hypothetical protein
VFITKISQGMLRRIVGMLEYCESYEAHMYTYGSEQFLGITAVSRLMWIYSWAISCYNQIKFWRNY